MEREEALRQLRLILDQSNTQNGRVLIQQMFREFRDDFHRHWATNIVNTVLSNIERNNNYSVTPAQMSWLADAVARNNLNLTKYYMGGNDRNQEQEQNAILKGIVISTDDDSTFILRSDGGVFNYDSRTFQPGQWIELRGDVPRISFFETGRDERWCEECWPDLVSLFEKGRADGDAILAVGKTVRAGLIRQAISNPDSSPRLVELLRQINI